MRFGLASKMSLRKGWKFGVGSLKSNSYLFFRLSVSNF